MRTFEKQDKLFQELTNLPDQQIRALFYRVFGWCEKSGNKDFFEGLSRCFARLKKEAK